MEPTEMTDKDWKKKLSKDQYKVLRQHGTERAFTGKLLKNKKDGIYICAGCGTPLFESDKKYESGSGWPSFFDTQFKDNIDLNEDRSFSMVRTEVKCSKCHGHLGHLFPDGPKPTGMRYCINSAALEFEEEKK